LKDTRTPWKPSPEQSLLVRACLSNCSELESFLRKWESEYDFDAIDFGCMRLLPYLYRRLEACGIVAVDHGRIKGIYTRYWYLHNTKAIPSLTELALLRNNGMRFLLLKGTSLQFLIYGQDPPTRPADDVDILINSDQLNAWVSQMSQLGFQSTSHYSQSYSLATRKSMGWEKPGSSIDLNWRLNEFSLDPAFEQRVFTRSVPISIRDFTFDSPCIADHFLHTVLHGSGWNQVPTVRWILDSCLLAREMSESDWLVVVTEIGLCGWRTPMLEQMEFLRDEYQANIPGWVINEVAALKKSHAGILAHRALTLPTRSARRRARVFYAEYLNNRNYMGGSGLGWKYPFRLPTVLISMFAEYRRATRT